METCNADRHDHEEPMDSDLGPEETVLAQVEGEELRRKLDEWLGSLAPRKARIIRYRYGLDDGQPHTLEETAVKFGTTRERIRQIEESTIVTYIHNRAHAALNAHRRLSDYMEN